MSKVVIYTALFTDNIEEVFGTLPEYDIDNINFVCFTNTPYLKSKTWDIRIVDINLKIFPYPVQDSHATSGATVN